MGVVGKSEDFHDVHSSALRFVLASEVTSENLSLLILEKLLPSCFSAALAVYPIKNTSLNALGFLGGDEGGSHAGALWLLA